MIILLLGLVESNTNVWFGRPAMPEQVKTMEKYMCSRFFIDFPDLSQQHNKLVKFLDNHFQGKLCCQGRGVAQWLACLHTEFSGSNPGPAL